LYTFRFEWNESHGVGNDILDDQHKQLIGIMNDYYFSMIQGKGDIKAKTYLEQLLAFAASHFAYEEEYLAGKGYPDLKNHKEEHDSFICSIKDFLRVASTPTISLPIDMLKFIKKWEQQHMLLTDKKYAEFISHRF